MAVVSASSNPVEGRLKSPSTSIPPESQYFILASHISTGWSAHGAGRSTDAWAPVGPSGKILLVVEDLVTTVAGATSYSPLFDFIGDQSFWVSPLAMDGTTALRMINQYNGASMDGVFGNAGAVGTVGWSPLESAARFVKIYASQEADSVTEVGIVTW